MILLVDLLLLGLGMILDAISYLIMSILIPVLAACPIDSIWYGVIFVSALAIGQVTPPVGVNPFTVANLIATDLDPVAKEAIRFVIGATVALIILSLVPSLSLCLPVKAGPFSAFPLTMSPLLVIMHFSHRVEHVHTTIKNGPKGIGSVLVYALAVNLWYPHLGVYLGTLARIMHEPPAATADMAVLPGVLGSRNLRRTEQVRLRSEPLWLPGGTTISAISRRRLVHNAG